MIGDGQFRAQLERIEQLLTKLALLADRQHSPNRSLGAAHFRGKPYREVYEISIRELAYDFRLTDQGLLLFTKAGKDIKTGTLSFSFYESPVAVMSYQEFVALQVGIIPSDPNYNKSIEEWADEFMSDYQGYVVSSDLKSLVTPLRYDYKAEDYRPGAHPASHLHFGFANNVRVATRRILNPIAFTLFILRQCYPDAWQRLLSWDESETVTRNVREFLNDVDALYWQSRDEQELFLS